MRINMCVMQLACRVSAILSFLTFAVAAVNDRQCGGLVTLRNPACASEMIVTIPSDGSGAYNFVLNTSMPIYSNQDINVRLENQDAVQAGTAGHLVYVVTHPSCEYTPRITSLVFNHRLLCENQPFTATTEHASTNFFFESSLTGKKSNVNNFQGPNHIHQRVGQSEGQGQGHDILSLWNQLQKIAENNLIKPTQNFSQNLGQNLDPVDVNSICGHSTTALVQGGQRVQPGEYPWLGGLFNREGNKYLCTVNLVSEKHAISAAHCFFTPDTPEVYGVLWGHPKNRRGPREYASLRTVLLHPGYTKSTVHDVAVIAMAQSVVFSHALKPICMWTAGQSGGSTSSEVKGVVAGFGPDYSDLQKIELKIVSQVTCRGSHINFYHLTSEFTFCAGSRKSDEGPCKGDSGAGYMQWVNDRYYLRGLVSHSLEANGNCNLREYIIFADLSKEMSWIRSAVS